MITDEKLQKILARIGLGSRREIEGWIEQGRVSVNGKVAKLGDRAKLADKIRVDGKLIRSQELPRRRVILYNKREGEVCTRKDPDGRDTVFDHLPRLHKGRWIAVGRLDLNTSGLLVFTNDGELANLMMHPKQEVERVYAVRVFGEVSDAVLRNLRNGVMLEDGMAKFDKLSEAGGEGRNHWYHVSLREGRNREVRRLWESQEIQVSRLIRIRYGDIELPRIVRQGTWMEMPNNEVAKLARSFGLEATTYRDEKKPTSHSRFKLGRKLENIKQKRRGKPRR